MFHRQPFDHSWFDHPRFERLRARLHAHHRRHHGHDDLFDHHDGEHGGGHHRHDWHAVLHAAGRFGARHGDGFFGMPDGLRGGGRRGGGRMFGHGDLKLLLLALIEQQPRHGYELIRTIEEMFHSHYSPSPGAIYPTLTLLEDMGHAQVQSETGGRKLYAVTDAGRTFLEENRAAVDAVMERTHDNARSAARMNLPESVHHAMHALRHAVLMHGAPWSKPQAARVAAILDRATSEIARLERD